jgi:hypothetical protein
MKKLFFAMLALCVAAISFTSCDNGLESTADPATQPIAGKTYREMAPGGDAYSQLTFLMNYKCTLVAKQAGQAAITNSNFEWWMSPNDPNVVVRYAKGAYDTETGESLSGKEFLSGTYNANTKTVTLTGGFRGQQATYNMTEVQ